jgi:hypothetical protein
MGEFEQHSVPSVEETKQQPAMFSVPPKESASRGFVLGVAVAAFVLLIVVTAAVRGHKSGGALPANSILATDSYAPSLALTDLAMSQSSSLAGATSTFLDGHIGNDGARIVTAATVQVLFRNDEGLSPTVETLPLAVIRTHEPYVDTEPLSAAPLRPGEEQEFRLIFETIPTNWNQQMPEIHIVKVATK